jgi:RNA polymerase sigma-70 factor (ECF subfamily)
MGSANDVRFASLYDRYYRHIYAYCRRRTTPDRLDDAVADTFLIARRRIDDVPHDREGLLWLYRVAYRVLGHQWRSASRRHKLDQKLVSLGKESPLPPEDFIVIHEEARQVLEAASRLNAKDTEILRLVAWEVLAHSDIADVLGISAGAVKQRLHRAKKNLTREYNRLDKKQAHTPAAQKGGAW